MNSPVSPIQWPGFYRTTLCLIAACCVGGGRLTAADPAGSSEAAAYHFDRVINRNVL